MYKLSKTSESRLNGCHPDLRLIVRGVIKEMDIAVLCGPRGKEEQNEAYRTGKSKVKYPNSKHNTGEEAGRELSDAVDIAPYPIDWNDISRFKKMLEIVERVAKEHNIKIRLGRDFSFKDYPHIERA